MTPIGSIFVALDFLLLFSIFSVVLIVQFRGDTWLPPWVWATLRRRPTSVFLRAANGLWVAMWTIGGQTIVGILVFRALDEGQPEAAAVLGTEMAAALALAIFALRASSGHRSLD